MEKVEGTGRINACIERLFRYKKRVNRIFLIISQLLEITEREAQRAPLVSEEIVGVRLQPLSLHSPVIPRSLPRESVRGEHFVLADILKSIPGNFSQARYAREPQTEIVEGALVSFVRSDQSPFGERDSQPAL